MKYLILVSLLVQTLVAQSVEVKQAMSLGTQSGIKIEIGNTKAEFIEKVWKKFTKDFGKNKENKKAGEFYIVDASVKSIRPEALDIYASIMDNSIIVFFDLKNGFLSSESHPKEFESARNLVAEFGFEVEREIIRDELEEESDKLNKSRKHMEKLKRDNNSYRKDIEEAKAKIKKAESNIDSNEKEQVKADTEIKAQTAIVEKVQEKLDKVGKSK
ncbi:MAG: hypothetical protein HOP11_05550 [Saprospiraceae bacterium]|nr:hypothetical protein [Saprospiraceae bacterium]